MTDLLAAPVRGYKLCRLRQDGERVVLAPLHDRVGALGWYSTSAYATCDEGHGHRAPDRSCTCGFYAVGTREELWRLGWASLSTPVLEVDLSGRLVEHRHGVRAERQDVRSISVPANCDRCGEPAVTLARHGRGRSSALRPACRRHARRPVSLEVVAESLGTEVRFDSTVELRLRRQSVAAVFSARMAPYGAITGGGLLGWVLGGQPAAAMATLPLTLAWLGVGRTLADRMLQRRCQGPLERVRVARRLQRWSIAITGAVWCLVAAPAAVWAMAVV